MKPSRALPALFLLILGGVAGLLLTSSDGAGSLAGGGVDRPEPDCLLPYEDVPGQGPSCRVGGGLWKVPLESGGFVLTHGPDPAAPAAGADAVAAARPIVCSESNPHGNYYQVAILAWPSDRTPNKTVAQVRADIELMNGQLYTDAVLSGSPGGADYVFDCDGTGQILVVQVQLSFPASQTSFSKIVSGLSGLGYNKTNEKYVIHWDAVTGFACGQGDVWPNESDVVGNPNNRGPNYGINYDCSPGWFVLMHENGHNLGAVQFNSPFSTGNGFHCWQEYDVMCYADGGNRYPGFLQYDCLDYDHWDCMNNDYFDAKIGAGTGGAPGSYIDTKWNLGECYVRWLVNAACSGGGGETTVYPTSVSIMKGSPAGGGAAQLGADDDQYYQVASTAAAPFKTTWTASFTGVPTSLTSAKLTYKGKNSSSCNQTVSLRNWATNKWAKLDQRSVGTTEVALTDIPPPGAAANFVSGAGEVKMRVLCKTQAGTFTASGDLAKLVYTAS